MNINDILESAFDKYMRGNLHQAADICSTILKTQPDHYRALHLMGSIYSRMGYHEEAIACLKKALSLNPSDDGLYYSIGNAFKENRQFDEAEAFYKQALKLNPENSLAYNNLGLILQETGDTNAAISLYKKALAINPHLILTYNNIGLALQERGDYKGALEFFNKALRYNHDIPDIRWNRSLSLLYSGDFKNGWREYEWRWKTKEFLPQECKLPVPLWDGSSLKRKILFISSEQGVGDEIMFASCFREIVNIAEKCIIECDRRFVPLFTRSFPEVDVIERITWQNPDRIKIASINARIPAGSLPGFLRHDLSSFPQQEAYLVADADNVKIWHERYSSLGDGLKVGISWRGGKNRVLQGIRSTVLSQWADLLSIKGVHFINLQYGDCAQELQKIFQNHRLTIHNWEDADPLKDLDGFAAQIAALDLVISVDNATVHIAGALGKPVWILLPVACDWRWMQDIQDSPWYRTVRLFRQKSPDDWHDVFSRAYILLNKIIKQGGYSKDVLLYPVNKSYKTKFRR